VVSNSFSSNSCAVTYRSNTTEGNRRLLSMSESFSIVTSRLRLESFLAETIELLLSGDTRGAESVQGINFSETFLQSIHEDFLAIQLQRMRARPSGRSWCIRAIVRDEDDAVIGHSGFHGPPEDVGRAEIGYNVLQPYRRNGYATEAVKGLVDWARRQGGIAVFASVSPNNWASIGVVTKLGFRHTGVEGHEGGGEEYIFELEL
jgi:[ribosomal protein S5]-alanine N-acetyltransferase